MLAHPLQCLHAHPWQGRPGRTPSVLSSCVLAAAPLRLRGRGVSTSDGSGPSCLSCSISSGLSPAPCALPIITIIFVFVLFCFVLFCFVLLFFHFFSFSRGHNWDIIPASRHNICLVQLRYCIFTYGIIYFIVQFVLCRSLTPFMDLFSEPLFI